MLNRFATFPKAVSTVLAARSAFVHVRVGDSGGVAATAQLEAVRLEALLPFAQTPSFAIRAVALGSADATACVAVESVIELILGCVPARPLDNNATTFAVSVVSNKEYEQVCVHWKSDTLRIPWQT